MTHTPSNCPQSIGQSALAAEIHRGLYMAWLLVFEATDSPYTAITPEYVATVMVANQICQTHLKSKPNLRLRFEGRAHEIASSCFKVPPFPRRKRTIPARRAGKKGDRECVDISIFDESAGIAPVAKHVVELKISSSRHGLREDLLRNKRLLELKDERSSNLLESTFLGFVIVDSKTVGQEDATKFRESIKRRYEKFLCKEFLSSEYVASVSVEKISSAPDPEDIGGEFRHMVSVVIAFERNSSVI
ncbi:hypothetical protein AOT14_04590 [Stenotrophomonas acidaminiphila]|uniref:Uncharacterized protein n=1 Tax=Stenotrophomonas acidaminiphila TaxID=128780 RepID=A0A0S1AVZ2_9GAMM|nr:hypothetical protein [Stenotrophomonas acidaminiphila]ALJ26907.1 hypothetical protein AOT14_04590 [Stenotrophomonas acidaminiphila]